MSGHIACIEKKRILFSPLNWGLGHLMRSIPIIEELSKKNEVLICCDAQQEKTYREFFNDLWYIPHDGYPFNFKGDGNWSAELLRNFKQLNRTRKNEHKTVEDLVTKFKIDLVISDQRYGFYSKKVKSILISHQIKLPLKNSKFQPGQWLNKYFINNYNEVWIPDDPKNQLSGKMGAVKGSKFVHIGIQSRFKNNGKKSSKKYKYLCIVSGPNPYAQHFFDELLEFLELSDENALIVTPSYVDIEEIPIHGNIKFITEPTLKAFETLFECSELVISRAGYSTLMDLTVLDKEAILVPTPGQHEQLYLAELHKNHSKWRFVESLKHL